MDEHVAFAKLLHDIVDSGMSLLQRSVNNPSDLLAHLEKIPTIFADSTLFGDYIRNHPDKFQSDYLAYASEAQQLLTKQYEHWSDIDSTALLQDRRFTAQEWQAHPFFQLVSQHYIVLEKHLLQMAAHMPVQDQPSVKRLQFLLQQLCHAFFPENFLFTNPQLLAMTIEQHGLNLLQGLRNFLHDLQTQNWQQWTMPLADQHAFIIGKDLAVTPGKIIYQNDLMELIQYTPQTIDVHAIPLLMIPPWINKYYILDLRPENSLARWLVEQGIVVYMISWRNPDKAHAHWGLSDYMHFGPLAAVQEIQRCLQIPKVSVLGFCIGGTLLALFLAYCKAQDLDIIASATFLASLIDFSEPGDLGIFIHEQQIQALEVQMQAQGYLEGSVMAAAFHSLRPSDLIWRVFVQRYLYGQPPAAFDLLFWNMDTTNMPATMQSEYLRQLYLNNDLIKPGKIQINDVPLDVSQIEVPTFFLSTQKDHIAVWQSTYRGFSLMQGSKKFVLGGSGHIAGIINPPGSEKYGYYTNEEYPQRAEDWLNNAQFHAGSWWPQWGMWLKGFAGECVPTCSLNLNHPGLRDAPGEYVYR